ncbi:MAG: helix-turn-helix domain-containing protein [Candidatus Omnitrophica bacterium]|nr:helix-turn-helix domain-containing protein [Candidatus Omnitrophota bacterium]MCA9449797.1 helix-turn-helix domain-containing protein [Candidatus Omnitrophota bacterium]MCB9784243.1 helix-turn-helix domain-containing protein [Candidatus Omnitrophota bacterium]
MKIERLLSDDAILAEIGERLVRRRLELDLSQATLADQAGVSKRTVGRIEAGESTQLSSIIRVLRVLDLVDRLDALAPESGPRPMDLLKLKGKERQRVSRKKKPPADQPWRWGDEE